MHQRFHEELGLKLPLTFADFNNEVRERYGLGNCGQMACWNRGRDSGGWRGRPLRLCAEKLARESLRYSDEQSRRTRHHRRRQDRQALKKLMSTQIANQAARDVIGRDKIDQHVYISSPTPLSRLYQILRDDDKSGNYTAQIADQLLHYCATKSADVRGLESKLKAGFREDLIFEAVELKERAAKLIMRWQTSPVTQDIITHVLAKIHGEFMLAVRPAIEACESRQQVDELIRTKVVSPTCEMLGDNDLGITMIDVVGLLFYLGGNCHIRWDKC
ncbi:ABC-three component system protein [Variovorax paradoxus]|uniref:ABC-three component system protein n=1 Tax=Variovorax paradoxus TaxID=34073 RepID=UPI003ED11EF6